MEPLGAAWEAMNAQKTHYDFRSIPFLKMPQINFSKGLALQNPILELASHINRFASPSLLKENSQNNERMKKKKTKKKKKKKKDKNFPLR